MGLPLLKDMLPEGLEEAFKPAPLLGTDSPDPVVSPKLTAAIENCEQKFKDLRVALNNFVDGLHRLELSEDDIESATGQVSVSEAELMEAIGRYSNVLREFRDTLKALPNTPRKFALLRICESQLKTYSGIRAMFVAAKDEIEVLRDSMLVHEAQELAANTFWGADDD